MVTPGEKGIRKNFGPGLWCLEMLFNFPVGRFAGENLFRGDVAHAIDDVVLHIVGFCALSACHRHQVALVLRHAEGP